MHIGLPYEDHDIKTLNIKTIMENIKDYQQYLRGYNYTGITPVIIDFYATWCGPCQALAPMLKRLADEYEGRIKVLKVDVDKNQALAAAARIQSIPTSWRTSLSRTGANGRKDQLIEIIIIPKLFLRIAMIWRIFRTFAI